MNTEKPFKDFVSFVFVAIFFFPILVRVKL